jgi:4a-hydroxytetrahydrobiopterin dehydratase
MRLRDRPCVPCHAGTPALTEEQRRELAVQIPAWELRGGKLRRQLELPSFPAVMSLLGRIAELAEAQGHHPDFCVSYRRLELTLWTHAINGLSESDYVMAAKLDALLEG